MIKLYFEYADTPEKAVTLIDKAYSDRLKTADILL